MWFSKIFVFFLLLSGVTAGTSTRHRRRVNNHKRNEKRKLDEELARKKRIQSAKNSPRHHEQIRIKAEQDKLWNEQVERFGTQSKNAVDIFTNALVSQDPSKFSSDGMIYDFCVVDIMYQDKTRTFCTLNQTQEKDDYNCFHSISVKKNHTVLGSDCQSVDNTCVHTVEVTHEFCSNHPFQSRPHPTESTTNKCWIDSFRKWFSTVGYLSIDMICLSMAVIILYLVVEYIKYYEKKHQKFE